MANLFEALAFLDIVAVRTGDPPYLWGLKTSEKREVKVGKKALQLTEYEERLLSMDIESLKEHISEIEKWVSHQAKENIARGTSSAFEKLLEDAEKRIESLKQVLRLKEDELRLLREKEEIERRVASLSEYTKGALRALEK